MAINLRGSIDSVGISDGYILVEGWVCKADGEQAEAPLSVTVGGHTFRGYNLFYRSDLAAANVAGGMAGIRAYIQRYSSADESLLEVSVVDLAGDSISIDVLRDAMVGIPARGAIDAVTGQTISGWLFDSSTSTTSGAAQLYFEDEFIASVVPHGGRPDLGIDLGDAYPAFGYEIASAPLIDEMKRAAPKFRGRPGKLVLANGGCLLATAEVSLLDNNIVLTSSKQAGPFERFLSSDLVLKLMTNRSWSREPAGAR